MGPAWDSLTPAPNEWDGNRIKGESRWYRGQRLREREGVMGQQCRMGAHVGKRYPLMTP